MHSQCNPCGALMGYMDAKTFDIALFHSSIIRLKLRTEELHGCENSIIYDGNRIVLCSIFCISYRCCIETSRSVLNAGPILCIVCAKMDRFCSDWLKPTKTDSKTRIITISRLLRILVENIQVPNLDKAATRTKNSSPTYSSCQSIS